MKSHVICLFSLLPAAAAQTPGTFTPAGNMTTARAFHTASMLPNGRVLMVGGALSVSERPAELYDPATGTFTATDGMAEPRSWHSATVLADGRVLIAGGAPSNSSSILKSAEIYDPSTGQFTATADMINPHQCHQGILLGNGKVLIVGGSGLPHDQSGAELYDPATGTFAPTGKYVSTDRPDFDNTCQEAVSALLPDGRILMVWEQSGTEIYDPNTGLFSPAGSLFTQVYGYNDGLPTLTVLLSGKVLIAGGASDAGITSGAELFDPATGTFTAAGNMSTGRLDNSATLLPDGSVLLAGYSGGAPLGGNLYQFSFTSNTSELYNPASGAFTTSGDMAAGRDGHTATLLGNGKVLIAGGNGLASAELYTPQRLIPAPVLFSLSGDGKGPGAILHASTQLVVSPNNPAIAGEALEIFGAGLSDGGAIPPQISIGGRMAEILYFGQAPGYAGVNQINVRVPGSIAPGPAVSVHLNYLGRFSNEVTIGIQ